MTNLNDPKAELLRLAGLAGQAAEALKKDSQGAETFSGLLETPAARDAALSSGPLSKSEGDALDLFRAEICECQKCPLGAARKKFVFGEGNHSPSLVFLGDIPETDDDLQGRPFRGPAGQLFTRILSAMNLKREDVYVLNLVKCRPPQGRPASESEIAACAPYWKRQLELLKPKVACALGEAAAEALGFGEGALKESPKRFHDFGGIPVLATWHPSQVLKNEGLKRQVWDDMKTLLKRLESAQGR